MRYIVICTCGQIVTMFIVMKCPKCNSYLWFTKIKITERYEGQLL